MSAHVVQCDFRFRFSTDMRKLLAFLLFFFVVLSVHALQNDIISNENNFFFFAPFIELVFSSSS